MMTQPSAKQSFAGQQFFDLGLFDALEFGVPSTPAKVAGAVRLTRTPQGFRLAVTQPDGRLEVRCDLEADAANAARMLDEQIQARAFNPTRQFHFFGVVERKSQ